MEDSDFTHFSKEILLDLEDDSDDNLHFIL